MKRYRNKKEEEDNENFHKVNEILKKFDKGYFSYKRIEEDLKRKGNPLKLSPAGFIICKLLCAFIGFMLFFDSAVLAVTMLVLGFFFLDLAMKYSDKQDMKKIRLEIVDIYDFLSIQTAAGVFIGSALTECYLIARNKRLKKALAELCAEINLTKNIISSLDKFGECFNSVEIDSFVLTIKQSLITGRIEEALNDLSSSQKDSNIMLIQEQTNKVKLSKDAVQMLMYIGILAVIMFGLYIEIQQNWNLIF